MIPEHVEWVLVAGPHGNGVRISASATVKDAHLDIVEKVDVAGVKTPAVWAVTPTYQHDHYRLTAKVVDLVTADGATYEEALRLLFRVWAPPEPPQPVRGVLGGQ